MANSDTLQFSPTIAKELELNLSGVKAVLNLIKEGATIPFIARYRKEQTGDLDEVQIRNIQERSEYLTELEERRQTILSSIEIQGKLDAQLKREILNCQSKTELEDLYLPYRPKRRTRATKARERGLEGLAELILSQGFDQQPEIAARAYVDPAKEVVDVEAALAGARDIAAEVIAERADIRAMVRERFWQEGLIEAKQVKKKDAPEQRTKFEQYYEHSEPIATIPSHRYLAIRRGEQEGVLRVGVAVNSEAMVNSVLNLAGLKPRSNFARELTLAVEDGFKRLIAPSIESDLRVELKLRSDREAVGVFAKNLSQVLMAAPLGRKAVVGIDPGFRTGCKCVAVDATGAFLDTITIYPHSGDKQESKAQLHLGRFIEKHQPAAIAVGNGTAGRETERFARQVVAQAKLAEAPILVLVNESGASIYSASDCAREEFPELDLTIRGAISIARRLQDPLAELVKIDPKSIGVGQYQHDVHQPLLKKKLKDVVESSVNQVGVEVNSASAELLQYIAGIGPTLAKRIVEHRNQSGAFASRKAIKKVAGMGPKTFEQAAGFLRVSESSNPLDASAVHPERYALVESIARDIGVPIEAMVGDEALVGRIQVDNYIGPEVGALTLNDIVDELRKPGRDPRDDFEAPSFREDVNEIGDLKVGMVLEGVVTNVTHFGAFVDIGVHQDGLVHISNLADRFVRDPNEVVRVGDKVKVKVLDLDLPRKRIGLTRRLEEPQLGQGLKNGRVQAKPRRPEGGQQQRGEKRNKSKGGGFSNNPFADIKKLF